MKFRIFMILAIAILVSSCASTPKFSSPKSAKDGMSVIYVYRPWRFAGGAASPTIQLDGVGESKLTNGSYLRFEVAPGQHKIAIEEKFDFVAAMTWPPVTIEVPAEKNKEYYVRYITTGEIIPGYFTTFKFQYAFQIVPADFALKELTAENK